MSAAKNHVEVVRLVARVRRRWRWRVALRGLAFTALLTLTVLLLSAAALERLRFVPEAVVWLRVLTWGTFAISLLAFLVRPLLRRVDDRRAALYLEEREPTLDHAVVSALEADAAHSHSPALLDRLVASALSEAHRIGDGRRVEQRAFYRFGGLLSAVAVASVALLLLGPEHLRTGLGALLSPTRDAASVNPYSIAVQPGDATIARGTDQMVTAAPGGFAAADASVFTRTGPDAQFQRLSMLPGDGDGFEVLLLGVSDRTEYFVESNGVRSATYTLDVADLPYVGRIDLTYHFPAYTGLPDRTVEDAGDVVGLPGTVVDVHVTPTMPAPSGNLVMDEKAGPALVPDADGTLVGSFTVDARGFYSVELARDNGQLVSASPEYTIDLLADQEPTIRFTKPGRDTPASPIEEVYLEVRADDDYGVGDVRLVYSVNGGPEDTVSVFRAGGAPLAEVSAGHTMFLEEWGLEPGDLVSYYALARDNRSRSGAKPVTSDIYFLNIRPFERTYREGESKPPGQGQGQTPESSLSEMQRQIVAATFNLLRRHDTYEAGEFSENVVSVGLSQGKLKEQVSTLVERMLARGVTESDPAFKTLTEILPQAADAMDQAKVRLDEESLDEALPHEQTALRFLQQAEETYERTVVQQQAGGGGGGGGQSATADDLADLFELELDKLENQYETVQRGQQQTADDQVDATLEKLKELARRQEQEAERQRRRAQAGQAGASGGGGQSQRDLAEQTEEAARELRKLAREADQPQLEETARSLEQAAEAMRRSAARSGNSGTSEAASALDRLAEAQRRLKDAQRDRARRDAEDALQTVDDMAARQRDVTGAVRDLPAQGPERADAVDRLRQRKDQMTETASELERQLDRAAAVARAEQPDAARELGAAADRIRESKLKEKLQYSKGTIEQWSKEQATTLELNIEADLQGLRDQLSKATEAAGQQTGPDPLEKALNDTRDLVRGMEAMDRRLKESTGQSEEARQNGQEAQPGGEPRQPGAKPGEPGGEPGEPGAKPDEPGGQPGAKPGEPGGKPGQPGQPGGQPGGRPGRPDQTGGQPGQAGSARPGSGGNAPTGAPRGLSDEETRQFRREFSQREGQVRDLRDRLSAAGVDATDLSAVLDAMRRLQRDGTYDDAAQVAALQDAILESLKRVEFDLRRTVEGTSQRRATLGGSDDVPDAYRKLVEEYYRKLAGGRPGGG